MSSKIKVIVLLAGLTLMALAALALNTPRTRNTPRVTASAVWGA